MNAPNRMLNLREPAGEFNQEPAKPRGLLRRTIISPATIRAKLVRILVIALALVVGLLGVLVGQQFSAEQQASSTVREVKLLIAVQSFVHEHQKERGLTTGLISGTSSFRAKLPAQRQATDAALAQVRQLVAGRNDAASTAVRADLGAVDQLGSIRSAADGGHGDLYATFDYFTNANTALTHLTMGLERAQDAQLHSGIQALLTLGNAKESTGQERALMTGSLPLGRFPRDWYTRFTEVRADRLANLADLPLWTTPAEQAQIDRIWTQPYAQQIQTWELQAVQGGGSLDDRAIPSDQWFAKMTLTVNDMRAAQITLGDDITARARALQVAAQRQLLLLGLLALAAFALIGALAVACIRSISAPLAALAREAEEIAGGRLPAAVGKVQEGGGEQPPPTPVLVPKRAGAEVRMVAEAFDQVQRVAFDLATEQTVLRRNATDSLVNLGRRNQNLVRRQIGFINKLEHEDADPTQLANLFELDHLATRMRRNAESLLVLAGESSPRPWATPLSVTDVIRAALSEVEEYRRVTLRRVDPVKITGAVVAEVAHLLAELIENALNFSPPDADVEIEGRRTSAGYLVAVVDHGLGMSPEALAEANVRLSGTASFMAEPTRFLGHFVVGSLARRHGMEVRLGDAPAAGVVARVLLPNTLLAETAKPREQQDSVPEWAGRALPADDAPELQREIDMGALPPIRTAARLGTEYTIGQPEPQPQVEPGTAARPAASVVGPRGAYDDLVGAGTRSPSAARTRNGLVKRPRRTAIPSAMTEVSGRWQAGEERTPERSPEEVRLMLSSFRAAHHRGETATLQTPVVQTDATVQDAMVQDAADQEIQPRETES
ncbi:signal transduction histidine kinase [Streptomyces sp. 846.5]|nr:signal transduction histidine kinase [Streptomyces sp. 846.5]